MEKMEHEQAWQLLNDYASAVVDYAFDKRESKTRIKRMEDAAARIFERLTGDKMPKELRERILQ